jgi:hypothetical protein
MPSSAIEPSRPGQSGLRARRTLAGVVPSSPADHQRSGQALPEDVQALASEITWSQIVGMRNILVHGYFDIDTDIVWDAAMRDVPAIETAVRRLLKTLEKQSQ